MKKTLQMLAISMFITSLHAQTLVNTEAQNRNVVLEDYSGIHCGYCPEGHEIAQSIADNNPGQVSILSIHAGSFSIPNTGEPDFRTTSGTALANTFGVTSYPSGTVDRHTFDAGFVLNRGAWEGAAEEAFQLASPVNIGVESSFDANTRELTVTVELYYTANSPASSNYIHVALKESHIIGYQTDYSNGNTNNYDHTHVFREFLTGTWGDESTSTTAGSLVTRTYNYTVPVEFNIDNCEVLAFVSEGQQEIYQGKTVAADGGTTLVVGALSNTSVNYVGGEPTVSETFNSSASNALPNDEEFIFTLSSDDAPADWSATFNIQGLTYSDMASVIMASGANEDIEVVITPGNTPGIATYTLSMASASEPNAPILENTYNMISGVTELVVSNPTALAYEGLYMSGLDLAGNSAKATTDRGTMISFASNNALGGVNNIYYNVSWTFPALTDATVDQLRAFMDNGGNLMIAGQDIGWDNSGVANTNGTANTEAFYADYMHAEYLADGSSANSQVDWVANDAVFGSVASSTINDIHNGNNYPEEINPLPPAEAIFNYNGNTNKVGGLRANTGTYKVVYLGIGVEQFSDASVADQVVQLSHDWFYGIVSVEEYDERLAAILGQNYPNPTHGVTLIPLNSLEEDATLRLVDATGKLVLSMQVTRGTANVQLTTAGLESGLYSYQLTSADGSSFARTMQVLH